MPKQTFREAGMMRTLVLHFIRFRHLKRDKQYWVLGTARAQSALAEGQTAVVYADEIGQLHVREYNEFHDGRFQKESD